MLLRAHEYNAALIGGTANVGANQHVPTAEADDALDYWSQLSIGSSGIMGRLKIPTIKVDLPIFHGASDSTLLKGVGHLQGATLPVGGPSTHSVLTAHRGLAEATLFTNLNQVVVGDRFTLEVFGDVLTYEVIQTQIVEPIDTETIRPRRGEDLVTLVTCTPLGINTQRILVTAERVTPTPIEDVQAAGVPPEIPGFPYWVFGVAATVLVAGGYIW